MIIQLKKHLPLMQYKYLCSIIRRLTYVYLYLLCHQNESFDDIMIILYARQSSSSVNILNRAFNTYTILYCDARVRVKYFPFHLTDE